MCDGTTSAMARTRAKGKAAVGIEIAGCEGGPVHFMFEAMPPVVGVGRSDASDVRVGQCVGSTVSRDHCQLYHDDAGGVVLRGNYPSNATRACHVSGGGEVLLEGDDEEQLLDGDQIFLPGRGDPVSVLTVTYLR